MSENFDLAEAVLEFAGGTAAGWEAFDKVIPNNIVVFTTDTMLFKKGNGADLYADLPDGPSFAEVQAGVAEIMDSLVNLTAGDDDGVIFINNDRYDVSPATLPAILTRISDIALMDTAQSTYLDTVDSQNNLVDQAVTAGDDDKLVVLASNKLSPGTTVDEMGGIVVAASPIHVKGVNVYTEAGLVYPVEHIRGNNTYFVEVDGFHDIEPNEGLTFTITESSSLTTIEQVDGNVFKLTVASLSSNEAVILAVSATFGADTVTRDYPINLFPAKPLVAIYGGASSELYYGCTTDSSGNIICVGYTESEGQGDKEALVVKFDGSLNIIARKIYGGVNTDTFFDCVINTSGNIFCAGYVGSDGSGSTDTLLLVKFDANLNILARKIYGGVGDDRFYSCTLDSSDNIFCAGYTESEGQGDRDGLVVKFDGSLNILARKIYGGTGTDAFWVCICDSFDNIICAGYTESEGEGSNDALVVKFDNNLSIIARKIYGGNSSDVFRSCAVDSVDNIICVGYTGSEGEGGYDALIVKFNASLSILARKVYGGISNDLLTSCAVDSADHIICAGYTSSEGEGGTCAFMIKFDANLNILARKVYCGSGADTFQTCAVDSADNIICAGYTYSEGQGNADTLTMVLPSDVPSGSFVSGTIAMTLMDSNLTLDDSALTLDDSALTLDDSTLTIANAALTIANSNLTLERDTLG